MTYEKPEVIIIDLTTAEALVALARCNGGAWKSGSCS